jgi:hypothetical protein
MKSSLESSKDLDYVTHFDVANHNRPWNLDQLINWIALGSTVDVQLSKDHPYEVSANVPLGFWGISNLVCYSPEKPDWPLSFSGSMNNGIYDLRIFSGPIGEDLRQGCMLFPLLHKEIEKTESGSLYVLLILKCLTPVQMLLENVKRRV